MSAFFGQNASQHGLCKPALRIVLLVLLTLIAWVLVAKVGVSLETRSSLVSSIEVLIDPDESLGIQEVSAPSIGSRFVRLSQTRSMGISDGNVWVRIAIHPLVPREEDWWLVLRSAILSDVHLYAPDGKGGYVSSQMAEEGNPPRGRVVLYRVPIFKLDLPANGVHTLYVRLKAHGSLIVAPEIWRPEDLVKNLLAEEVLHGGFVALQTLLGLGFIWLWRRSRNRVHVLHAGFAIFSIPILLAREGYLLAFFGPTASTLADFVRLTSLLVCLPLSASFVLGLGGTSRRSERVVSAYIVVLAVQSLLTLLIAASGEFGAAIWFYNIWAIANLVIISSVLILYSHHHSRRWSIFAAAVVLLTGSGLTYFLNKGWLPATPLINNSLYLSMGAFPLLMLRVFFHKYESLWAASVNAMQTEIHRMTSAAQEMEMKLVKQATALDDALRMATGALESERKTREEQQQFFSTVSHELRTPLAIIDAAAMNLQLDLPAGDETARLRCGRIRRAVDQLALLINNCLQADRVVPQYRGAHYEETDPRALFYDAYDAARLLSTKHKLHLELEALPVQIVCDPELTRLALRSLAINAIKFTPAGSNVWLTGTCADAETVLMVKDDGPGVSEKDLQKLFRRYYRGENAIGIPGTGLGLSLAREMIETQGGRMEVESSLGRGFTVRIVLPRDPIKRKGTASTLDCA